MPDNNDGDELCEACSKFDFFSLFTGPRNYPEMGVEIGPSLLVELGTLQDIRTNVNCPLCRLMKHEVYGHDVSSEKTPFSGEYDAAKIRIALVPVRTDENATDSKYNNADTRALLASRVGWHLNGTQNSSKVELDWIYHLLRNNNSAGIQLLSPESIDPARPLLNGFRAGTMESSLALLSEWIQTCHEHHRKSCGEQGAVSGLQVGLDEIRVIDVWKRKLSYRDPATVSYAALSYVWGQDTENYAKLAEELWAHNHDDGSESIFLPPAAPKVIEDALSVCKSIGVPYLWVDLYCVHQTDETQKLAEINAMGQIYHNSHITLVAGLTSGLLPASATDDLGANQKVETIGGRKYISALPSLINQIRDSAWYTRGWTYQEGQMAKRVAFFGQHDVSFLCGAGHWRESHHSGSYGHDARIPDIDLRSHGFHTLSALGWLRTPDWDFRDYNDILVGYSQRTLSFQSDKLNAISGCLDLLAQTKGIHFFSGLPSADFHYALLWDGDSDYDRPLPDFPSWSWAGWNAPMQRHFIRPHTGTSGTLRQTTNGDFKSEDHEPPDIELEGDFFPEPHQYNKCSQSLASLRVSQSGSTVTVRSEVAKFYLHMNAESEPMPSEVAQAEEWFPKETWADIPPDFTTQSSHIPLNWESETLYILPSYRMFYQDTSGNSYTMHEDWENQDHWPPFAMLLPGALRGSTLIWLLRDGIELIKIVEVKLLEGEEGLLPFHSVLCLGIDRSEGIPGCGRRMGVFCVPKEGWDKAGPEEIKVEFS